MKNITIAIKYAGLELPIVKNDKGEDVTPLKPIADLFGLSWSDQHKKLSAGAEMAEYLGVCIGDIPHAGGQKREQTCIKLSRVAAYLMAINPDRVRAAGNIAGASYLIEKMNEWADALHDYELLGEAINLNHEKHRSSLRRDRICFAQMIRIKNSTPAANDRSALSQVISTMAAELGATYQPDLLEGAQ